MKRNLSLSLMAALALCGCQNMELDEQVPVQKVFTATIEDNDLSTKTSLDEYGNVLWMAGDQVSIFAASTINQQYQVTDESDGQTSASLNPVSSPGFVAGGEIPNNVAFYPYSSSNTIAKNATGYVVSTALPSVQNYADASFGNGAFPMAAVTTSTTDMNLKFKNVLGGLKLQLKGAASIASISVTGNNDEPLYGAAAVTLSTNSTPAINLTDASAKTVTLDCGSGVQLNESTATPFVIALPPMTMTGGFTVVVTDTEGKEMVIKTTKSQTITRSSILRMPEVMVETIAPVEPNPTHNGYEYVDLGLSVKWATMNVGATKPEEYGDYFAWGETEPYYEDGYAQEDPQKHWKDWEDSENYAYADGFNKYYGNNEVHHWTKYTYWCSYMNYYTNAEFFTDNKAVLDSEDDVAHVNWGGDWHMPTAAEQDELLNTDNCSWTWTTMNGINGYKVQSKKIGYTDNWIFLPAAGSRKDDRLLELGSFGAYWSNSLNTDIDDDGIACMFAFSSSDVYRGDFYRGWGRSVRPVCP
ncbi:MAG: fimbrillin family protein [Bacteroidales bacterium]|nr:fimbrillin family protein [Bacteroidales bacterium]